jgi:hypothetical protein
MIYSPRALSLFAGLALASIPSTGFACACGCGVFDVGVGNMMSSDTEFSIWTRYAYMNQNQNWEGGSKAPASDNTDKQINTSFYTIGGQYRISPAWTVMAEVPTYDRHLTTTDDGTVFGAAGSIYTGKISDLGDMQITSTYKGLSDDMSTGITFGAKLPTGNSTGPNGPLGGAEFDRDSLPGTGSTDLIVGAYHGGALNEEETLSYFVQLRYEFAVLTRESYRPGNDLNGAVGTTYDFGETGPFSRVAPVLQFIGSYRMHDTGANSDPLNSGYHRVLIAPGLEVRYNQLRIYGDVEKTLYQYANAASSVATEGTSGQLVASTLYKLQVSYDF